MEKGYRIPRIDEFILGFEYDVYSDGASIESIEDFSGWYSYRFNKGLCFRDIDDINTELERGNIRVKINK